MVSKNFKKYILENGKEISIKLSWDDIIFEKSGIRKCSKNTMGSLYKSLMQYIDLEIEGNIDVKDKEINVEFGVSYDGSNYEYVQWGTFIVDKETIQYSVEKNTTSFTAYDFIIKSHVSYDLNISYPLTIKGFLLKICERLGYTLANETFVNSTQVISNEKYIDIGDVTFRDVLDEIAGVSASTIIIDGKNLELKYPTITDYIIDEHNLKTMSILDKFGPVNSVVLAREPQEDNFYKQDEESIEINGLTEIRFSNNELMDKNREVYIDEIFDHLNGHYYYPYIVETYGFCYFKPLDIVTIKDLDGNEYKTIILNDVIEVTTGVKETLNIEKPECITTDYSKATKDKKELHKVQLYVDKQNKKIVADLETNKLQIDKLTNSINVSLVLNYVNSQTRDKKLNKYYPDYTTQNLKITAIAKDTLKNVIADAVFVFKRKGQSDEEFVDLIEGETVVNNILNISHNLLESVEYKAYATVAVDDVVFTAEQSITINLNVLNDVVIDESICSIESSSSKFVETEDSYNPGNIVLIPKLFNCNFDLWMYSIDLGITYESIVIGEVLEDDDVLTNVEGITFNVKTNELNIVNDSKCFNLTNVVVFKLKGDIEGATNTIVITKDSDIATQVNRIITDMNQLSEKYTNVSQELNALSGSITSKVENMETIYNGEVEEINKKLTEVIQTADSIEEQYTILKEIIDENGSELQTITTYIRKTTKGIEVGEKDANVKTLMGTSYFAILFNDEEVMKLEQNLLTIDRIMAHSSFMLGNSVFTVKNYGFDITWGGD